MSIAIDFAPASQLISERRYEEGIELINSIARTRDLQASELYILAVAHLQMANKYKDDLSFAVPLKSPGREHVDHAMNILLSLNTVYSHSSEYFYYIAQAYQLKGDYAHALPCLSRALKLSNQRLNGSYAVKDRSIPPETNAYSIDLNEGSLCKGAFSPYNSQNGHSAHSGQSSPSSENRANYDALNANADAKANASGSDANHKGLKSADGLDNYSDAAQSILDSQVSSMSEQNHDLKGLARRFKDGAPDDENVSLSYESQYESQITDRILDESYLSYSLEQNTLQVLMELNKDKLNKYFIYPLEERISETLKDLKNSEKSIMSALKSQQESDEVQNATRAYARSLVAKCFHFTRFGGIGDLKKGKTMNVALSYSTNPYLLLIYQAFMHELEQERANNPDIFKDFNFEIGYPSGLNLDVFFPEGGFTTDDIKVWVLPAAKLNTASSAVNANGTANSNADHVASTDLTSVKRFDIKLYCKLIVPILQMHNDKLAMVSLLKQLVIASLGERVASVYINSIEVVDKELNTVSGVDIGEDTGDGSIRLSKLLALLKSLDLKLEVSLDEVYASLYRTYRYDIKEVKARASLSTLRSDIFFGSCIVPALQDEYLRGINATVAEMMDNALVPAMIAIPLSNFKYDKPQELSHQILERRADLEAYLKAKMNAFSVFAIGQATGTLATYLDVATTDFVSLQTHVKNYAQEHHLTGVQLQIYMKGALPIHLS